ncbi:17210_t:CDS:1, partial [Gigaspora rosea]
MKSRIDLEIVGLSQILDLTGRELITWNQIVSRERSMKGKVPRWFSRIEEVVLRIPDSRELKKEFQLEAENHVVLLLRLEKLQTDKRVKDW